MVYTHKAQNKAQKINQTPQESKTGNTLIGVVMTTRKGAGYIDISSEPGKKSRSKDGSIYIEEGTLNTALNGDTIEVRVSQKSIRGVSQKVGEVLRIINRAKTYYVGVVTLEQGQLQVVPDDKKSYVNFVLVPKDASSTAQEELKNIKADDKVYIKMQSWTDARSLPTATLVKVLGKKGINNVEMESIVLEKGFEMNFPAAVEQEANTIEKNERIISVEEIAKRRDMRDVDTFTIDPFDAKDFDDAISFKKITDGEHVGRYEIGIHIADVSHYVRPGSALDQEAVKRGCSIYLVDRTIPMLPEALSNDVCSLNPHEDKLTFSAVFIMDEKGNIHDRWFGKTVINSTYRFTYEVAQAVMDGTPAHVEMYSKGIQKAASVEPAMHYRESLVILNNIAKILQREKFARGAIEFETQEIKFRLDAQGKPVGVYVYERFDAHKLVEEYMLLANREVAKFVFDQIKKKGKRDTGAIYRIHETPDKERIKDLAVFVHALGYDLKVGTDGVVTAHHINDLLEQIEGKPQENLIRIAVLRSMQKAVYSTKNVGHFGLAFKFYTHFTSPIRRYPDLLVHRILARHLHHEPFGDKEVIAFQHVADSSTRREIDAAEAERDSKKLKQVEYMSERIGQVFEGTISGVTKWGIYVEEKESKSEGMIAIRNLGDDYFVFNERTYSIIGEKTKKLFTLGDSVKFKVSAADIDRKTLDYTLVGV